MILNTPITDYGKTFQILPQDKILALGSCFANVVGKRMSDNLIKTTLNPFGTLYNPKSIFSILSLGLDILEGNVDFEDLCKSIIFRSNHDVWYSWLSSSNIKGITFEECKNKFIQSLQLVATRLQELDILMITFGTSHYYCLKDGIAGLCVANCHKMPSYIFEEKEMSVAEIITDFRHIISRLRKVRPTIKIIATVSPYRYLKYGMHKNQISKATLLIAIEECMKEHEDVFYFPAYEILNDELRDYRFYAPDMVHPSEVTENYIWEKFSQLYFSEQLRSFIQEWSQIIKMKSHRPSSDAEGTRLEYEINKRVDKIRSKYPLMF